MDYNKLVRDKVPEIICESGDTPITHTAKYPEYERMLDEKLKEECKEFLDSKSPEELADILEVIYAIGEIMRLTPADLESLRISKAEKRGTFSKRIILERTQ